MMTDFRALCAELADAYLRTLEHINNSTWLGYEPSDDPLLQRARAALADEPPEPAPPADGEVAGLVEMLKGIAYWRLHGTDKPTPFDIRQAARLTRAADLLQRQVLPEVNQMAWQPIDTAPRDGTEILASDYDAIEIVSWVGPRFDVGITGEWTNREGEAMYPAWWQPLPDHLPLPGQEVGE